jgi:hypothetical protein
MSSATPDIPLENAPDQIKTVLPHAPDGQSDIKGHPGSRDNRVVIPLEPTIRWKGDGLGDQGAVILRQIKREGNIAIYSRTKEGGIEAYEVIKIRVRPARTLFGHHTPGREVYPSAKEFGHFGKFVTTLARAEEVFSGMQQQQKQQKEN